MIFKYLPGLRKIIYTGFSLFIIFYCTPLFAFSLEYSCLNQNKQFISRYFSGQAKPQEIEFFFDCIDNTIQLFLNHTRTKNPNYYTQTEIRRFMQYMGSNRTRAEAISQAMLNLKKGFIGGNKNQLSLSEIILCRQILSIFRQRMRALRFIMPKLINTLNKKNITRQQLINATETMKTNLLALGNQLSKKKFSSDLSLLSQLPKNIETLGFSRTNLKYWRPALRLLSQWKNIFLSSPKQIIQNNEWPFLLDSFGQLATLWLYHKRFLEGRSWINFHAIQHTQHFLSHSMDLARNAQKQYGKRDISLTNIDELARRVWFLPYLSTPVFRLAVRSTFCFLLDPLTNNKTCKYNLDFKNSNTKISFSDMTFTITETKEIYESKSGKKSDQIKKPHLEILKSYLGSWINSENTIRRTSLLPPLFGSPNKWLKRRMDITSDRRLLFYKERTDDHPFLSHLNWQSHLMKLVTSAYTKRGTKVNHTLWKTMIREWTALSISLYKDMQWQSFQTLGYQIFRHGDFLTSHSNGDKILQEQEILELFSIFMSSLSTVISALDVMQSCKSKKPHYLHTDCIRDHLSHLPQKIFTGFPKLSEELAQDEKKKTSYIDKLHSFYNKKETLSLKNLFELFLFVHYQENTMEYLDRNSSQDLDAWELVSLLDIFESTLIDDIPLIYTKKEAFAFITYLFHYGEIPIFDKKISSPTQFSHWLLKPEKWKELKADRKDVLHTLFLMNKDFR